MAAARSLPPRDAAPVDDADLPEPPRLRVLRLLVMALTGTLILGMLTITGALVLRISRPHDGATAFDPAAVAAQSIALPPGQTVTATGAAGGALMLVARDDAGAEWLHLFDAASGALVRSVAIARTAP